MREIFPGAILNRPELYNLTMLQLTPERGIMPPSINRGGLIWTKPFTKLQTGKGERDHIGTPCVLNAERNSSKERTVEIKMPSGVVENVTQNLDQRTYAARHIGITGIGQ